MPKPIKRGTRHFCRFLFVLLLSAASLDAASKFSLNNRIQANADCNVRPSASTSGNPLFLQGIGSYGSVLGGPSTNSGFVWYFIDWDNTTTNGWTADTLLSLAAPVTVSPGGSPPVLQSDYKVTFSWNSVAGASRYYVFWRDTNSGVRFERDFSSQRLQSDPIELLHGHNYRWNMTSSNAAAGESGVSGTRFFGIGLSDLVLQQGNSGISPSPNPAMAGSDLSVSYTINNIGNCAAKPSSTRVQLKRGASFDTTAEVFTDTIGIGANASVAQTATIAVPVGAPEDTYTIYVILDRRNESGQGANTNNDIYSTSIQVIRPRPPVAPSSLTAEGIVNGISLRWNDNSDNERGFAVQRREVSTGTYTTYAAGSNATTFVDITTSPSVQYCYTVRATNTVGESTQTSEACATFAPSPSPIARFYGDLHPVTGKAVVFDGTLSSGSGLTYSWTTSAGHTSSSSRPTFTFYSPGQYVVSLRITDQIGRSDVAAVQVNVQAANNGTAAGQPLGADPVVLSSGNYIHQHIDLRLPGKGIPFEFKRFYNSKYSDQTGKPLGYGWTFSYNERVWDTGTNVLVIQGDGSTVTFFPTNNGYVGEQGVFDSLTHNPDNTWSVTSKDQSIRRFGANGQLSSITDRNGHTLDFFYTNGILRKIHDTAERSILLNTNFLGCISDLTDPMGRTIRFEYDANTNLIAAVDAKNQTNRYSYDATHQMTGAFDRKGTLFVHNEYNPTNFTVVKQHDALTNWTYFAYDFSHRVTYQTNALGKVSIYAFDDRLLVTNILDEATNRQIFYYDSNRNQTFVQNKNGHQTHYAYDSLGNVTNKLDAADNRTSIEYGEINNPISRVDALTNTIRFGYDANGNLTVTTNALGFTSRVQYNAEGLPFILTDARGFNTTNQYDSEGNLVAIVDAKGFTNRFEYDAAGRKIRQFDALNRTHSFVYDNNDNLLYSVNALGCTNFHTYDANNNRTSSRNPADAITTNIFDVKDRLVKIIAPLNQTVSNSFDVLDRKTASFDALQNSTAYVYDDIGNVIAVTNALTQPTRFTFDAQGNQTSLIDPTGHYVTNLLDELNRKFAIINTSVSTNGTAFDVFGRVIATTNANGQVTGFLHDAIGRLTNVVDGANESVSFVYDENGNRIRTINSKNHTWTNVFDELNRLVEQDDPVGHKMLFRYDPVGNLTNKVTPNGDSISYFYDALNRLTNITYPSSPPVSFAYDSVGNRTNMTDAVGTTSWEYDLLNRLVSITDPHGQTVAYGYDANGNRTSLTYPGNKTVRYGFDSLNRLIALTNWLGGVITYSYDNRGNLIAATNANNTTVVYGYDVAGRLLTLTNATPNGNLIAGYTVTLDGVGNHRDVAHEQPLFSILPNQTNLYASDYDNRLTAIDGQTVTYNANGGLTSIGPNTYAYDVEDRLTQFALTNASGTCSYDGLDNRLARTLNGHTCRFVLDRVGELTQVLIETDTNGSPVAYYVYGIGLAQRITPDGQTATYHFNIQGSTVALTDSAGTITDSYAYDSFGVLANADGDSPQPFRYLGRHSVIDETTGLYHARARYFSSQLGRFLIKDPLTGDDGQSLHRYIYALNNPLRFMDATGLSPREITPTQDDTWSRFMKALLGESIETGAWNVVEYFDSKLAGLIAEYSKLNPKIVGQVSAKVLVYAKVVYDSGIVPPFNALRDTYEHPDRDNVEAMARYFTDIGVSPAISILELYIGQNGRRAELMGEALGFGAGTIKDATDLRLKLQDAMLHNPVSQWYGEQLYGAFHGTSFGRFLGF